jgi:hypothetical protein
MRRQRSTAACLLLLAGLSGIAAGEPDKQAPPARGWSLRPIIKALPPEPPERFKAWPVNPIDRFVLDKLLAKRLEPSLPADRASLIRRVYFDLIGLPPTPEDVAAFLKDDSAAAYEKVVDRLLASPRYGERWARHWMDVIHFAETHGHDQDVPREHAWPYRDYLIRSLNDDKPYGRFIEEQIAGDVLFPGEPAAVVALGFLAAGPWDESSLRDIRADTLDRKAAQYLDRDDMIGTVSFAFLSTTVQCARCHDHKFDPITQEEYYGLQAVFAGIDRANRTYDTDPKVHGRRLELDGLKKALVTGPHAIARLLPNAFGKLALALWIEGELTALGPPKLVFAASADFKPDGSFTPAQGCRPIHMLRRGDIKKPGAEMAPGALACVPDLEPNFMLARPDDEGQRRAALARWISSPKNPLTWRSIANRLWHYHFGRGIVATPSDFGRMGAAPTHPELLDWLAATLLEEGGSLKKLQRRIVTSATYRQASTHNVAFAKLDADNAYLWRMHRARLDAETLRDAVLQISGRLDLTMGGPSVKHFVQSPGIHRTPKVDYIAFGPDSPGAHRRSIYRFIFRTVPDPLFDALDCPDASQFTAVRTNSITALQALTLLNDPFMVRMSEHFAKRVAVAGPAAEQVKLAYRLALGREPSEKESAALTSYASRHGMANACRLLFNCNEFMFVP